MILFIASSLDGFIAGPRGEIDWLFHDADYGYRSFFASIDTVLMGRKTYDLSRSFGDWPYPKKTVFVFSRKKQAPDPRVLFAKNPVATARKILRKKGKNVWIVGGSQIVTEFLNAGLVHEIVLSIHPLVLGKGIPLFSKIEKRHGFRLQKARGFPSGLVQLTYRKK